MKKILALTLALLMVFALTACGAEPTPAPAAPAAGAPAEAAPAKETTPEYPTKNLNGVIAWGAGGGTDNVMRAICPLAEDILGKTIVLTNKTGGTGSIATQYVYTQAADGYTILFNAENPPLYKVLGLGEIDYENYIPVVILAKNIGIIVVPTDSPFQTYQDVIDYAKANPGRLNVGTTGVGGLPFNCFSLTCMVEGIEYNAVTYDGDGPLLPALIGGEVDISVIGQSAAMDNIAVGNLRALGVYAAERCANEELTDVPSLVECNAAYDGMLDSWGPFYGAFVKEGTPDYAVKALQDAFGEAAQNQEFLDFCNTKCLQPLGLVGDDAVDFIKGWQSMTCWALYNAGATKSSPADFGIPEP